MKMSVVEENSIALCMVRAAPGAGPSPMSPTPLESDNKCDIKDVKICTNMKVTGVFGLGGFELVKEKTAENPSTSFPYY